MVSSCFPRGHKSLEVLQILQEVMGQLCNFELFSGKFLSCLVLFIREIFLDVNNPNWRGL